jgi:hypothetical protein
VITTAGGTSVDSGADGPSTPRNPKLGERLDNACNRERKVAQHESRVQSEHPIPEPRKLPIAPRVRALSPCVRAPLHFDDEPNRRIRKVGNPPTDDVLPAKGDPELAADEALPELPFRLRLPGAELTGAL